MNKKKNTKDLDCISCTDLSQKLRTTPRQIPPIFYSCACYELSAALFQNETYERIFASLRGESEIFINRNADVFQVFTVNIYDIKHFTSVNIASDRSFLNINSRKNGSGHLLKN